MDECRCVGKVSWSAFRRNDSLSGLEEMKRRGEMMKPVKSYLVLLSLLTLSVLLVSCSTTDLSNISENKLCQKDNDCVPNTCCHATDAVNQQNAPKCTGMLCTMECVPETLDCVQGEIKCVKNECNLIFK